MAQERFVTRKNMLRNITSQIEELEHRIKSLKSSFHHKLDHIENSIINNDNTNNILSKLGTDSDDPTATIFNELEEIEVAIGMCSAGTLCAQVGAANSTIISAINNETTTLLSKLGTDSDDPDATIFDELEQIEVAIGRCSAGTICGQIGVANSTIISAINNETETLLAYIKAASYTQTCAQNSDCPSGFICGSTGVAYGGYASGGVAHGGLALAHKVCVSGHLTAINILT